MLLHPTETLTTLDHIMNTEIFHTKADAERAAFELARKALRASGMSYATPDAEPDNWVVSAVVAGMEAMRQSRSRELHAEHTLVLEATVARMDPRSVMHVTVAAVLEAINGASEQPAVGDPYVILDLDLAQTVSDRYVLEYSPVEDDADSPAEPKRVKMTLVRKVLQS